MKLLSPLSTEVKLSLISKLSESVLKEINSSSKTKVASVSGFFDASNSNSKETH